MNLMKRNLLPYLLCTALLTLSPLATAQMKLSDFKVDSYKEIVARYQDSSFLMVLWSIDCPPCIEELPTLGKFHQLHPEANLVMVSTDGEYHKDDIQQLMREHGLDDIQQWVFSSVSLQAMRYAIDPTWYGELPRSYFHHKQHKRQVKSGRLDEDVLIAWIELVNSRTAGL
ncbi:MAG: TlpA family protein disulfide reductase [Gammaproteobacteria bacterium]|nr:TlpA family protein disulfide reductase [Gammaproteobacteria bacterium]